MISSLWLVSVKSNLDLQRGKEKEREVAGTDAAARLKACAKCLMQFAGAQTQ